VLGALGACLQTATLGEQRTMMTAGVPNGSCLTQTAVCWPVSQKVLGMQAAEKCTPRIAQHPLLLHWLLTSLCAPVLLAVLLVPGGRLDEGGPPHGSSVLPGAAAAAAGSSGPVLLTSNSISVAGPGSAASSPGPRASAIGRPFQGVVASLPEAGGLPYDEKYAYLCLLRRSVLYGPTLGLPTGAPAGGGGRASMMSFTGAAPGSLSHCNSMVM
jgi:hypothetical protein